jgi:hypothetical protein
MCAVFAQVGDTYFSQLVWAHPEQASMPPRAVVVAALLQLAAAAITLPIYSGYVGVQGEGCGHQAAGSEGDCLGR